MLRFASSDLWALIGELSAKAGRKHAAIAYVTSDTHFKVGRGDVLVTDASDEAIKGGRTSAALLKRANRDGAKLYSVPGLHAKVFCLGRYVVVGSANASASSADDLIEAGVVSDNPSLLAQTRAFVEQLAQGAAEIDLAFLRRIAAIEVVSQPPTTAKRRLNMQDHQSRMWLVGLRELDERRFEHEAEQVERGEAVAATKLADENGDISWLRFTGRSKFRLDAKPGDAVVQIWQPHAKSRVSVYFPAPVVHRQEEPSCTRFYVEDFSDSEERSISWTAFLRIWKSAAGAKPPPVMCARLLPDDVAEKLVALWPE